MAPPHAAVFTIHAISHKPRVSCTLKSDEDIFPKLSDAAKDFLVKEFMFLEHKTHRSQKVEADNRDSIEEFVSAMRAKLLDKLSQEETERLKSLEEKRAADGLEPDEKEELNALLTVHQDLILVDDGERSSPAPADSDSSAHAPAAKSTASSAGEAAPPKDPQPKSMTLRFAGEKNSSGNVVEVAVPFSGSFREVCDALQLRFRIPVHFRYQNGQKDWVEVRSQRALGTFTKHLALGADAASTSVLADVQLLQLGKGVFPLLPLVDDVGAPGAVGHLTLAKFRLLGCVTKAAVNEASAAEEARALVQAGSPASELLDQADEMGRSALHLAAEKGLHVLCWAITAAPAQVARAMVDARDLHGQTPLHHASGDETAMALLKARADPNARDKTGAAPLHSLLDPDVGFRIVCGRKHGGVSDADVNLRDSMGRTPLIAHAASPEAIDMLTWLVDRVPGLVNSDDEPLSVDLGAGDAFGRTAVHHAAASNNSLALQILFKTGQADVNAKDNFGMSPLHLAARAGHVKAAGFLVSQRCDVTARDSAGRTAEDLTHHEGLSRIISANPTPAPRTK